MNKITERLIEGNQKYLATEAFAGDVSAKRREANKAGQKPYAVIVTCSDSRVIPETVFSAGIGELFVVRTAGNVIGEAELASIDYAVEHLKAGCVVVMGHTGCGAVKAALSGEFEDPVGVITRQIKKAIGNTTDPDKACELNVLQGVSFLKTVLDGTGVVVTGAVYDIVSGKVRFIS